MDTPRGDRTHDRTHRANQLKQLRDTGSGIGYLTHCPGTNPLVTTWAGLPLLAVVPGSIRVTHRTLGGHPYTDHTFRAFDPTTGHQYAGRGPGPGMYCRLQRIKAKATTKATTRS